MHRIRISRAVLGLALAASAALAASRPAVALPAEKQSDAKTAQSGGMVDINTAGVEELMSVPGIGEVIAQRIVEFREKNGAYASVEDLIKVQGIGEKSLEKLRPYVTVGKGR